LTSDGLVTFCCAWPRRHFAGRSRTGICSAELDVRLRTLSALPVGSWTELLLDVLLALTFEPLYGDGAGAAGRKLRFSCCNVVRCIL